MKDIKCNHLFIKLGRKSSSHIGILGTDSVRYVNWVYLVKLKKKKMFVYPHAYNKGGYLLLYRMNLIKKTTLCPEKIYTGRKIVMLVTV